MWISAVSLSSPILGSRVEEIPLIWQMCRGVVERGPLAVPSRMLKLQFILSTLELGLKETGEIKEVFFPPFNFAESQDVIKYGDELRNIMNSVFSWHDQHVAHPGLYILSLLECMKNYLAHIPYSAAYITSF